MKATIDADTGVFASSPAPKGRNANPRAPDFSRNTDKCPVRAHARARRAKSGFSARAGFSDQYARTRETADDVGAFCAQYAREREEQAERAGPKALRLGEGLDYAR
jgi:hypothetical protein